MNQSSRSQIQLKIIHLHIVVAAQVVVLFQEQNVADWLFSASSYVYTFPSLNEGPLSARTQLCYSCRLLPKQIVRRNGVCDDQKRYMHVYLASFISTSTRPAVWWTMLLSPSIRGLGPSCPRGTSFVVVSLSTIASILT